jgi:hypothetical protein
VEGSACKNIEIQGLFKENSSIEPWIFEPWIFDPTAATVVDHIVDTAHGSTMD